MPYSAPDAVYCSNNLNYNENRYLIENISDPIVSQSLLSMDMTNEQTASGTNSQALNKQINYSRYKTELCRQFSENGECKYGDKCQFAHGINDLKLLAITVKKATTSTSTATTITNTIHLHM